MLEILLRLTPTSPYENQNPDRILRLPSVVPDGVN
jgi:hypothetical protein